MNTIDILPLPITFLQRHTIAKNAWRSVVPEKPFPGLRSHREIDTNGPFKVLEICSGENSFYKSLSWCIFETEEYASLIQNAVLKHAKENTFTLRKIFLKEKSYFDKSDNIYESLRLAVKSNQMATILDVYTACHFFQIGILLIDSSDPNNIRHVTPNQVDSRKRGDLKKAILLSYSPNGGQNTYDFAPVISYTRDRSTVEKDKNDESEEHNTSSTQTDLSLSLTPEELGANVILLDRSNQSYVAIPYVIAKTYSEDLSEFVGEMLTTSMSAFTLQRLKAYLFGPSQILDSLLDADLYEFAMRWSIGSLAKTIEAIAMKSNLSAAVSFINGITLNGICPLFNHIKTLVYRAPVEELKAVVFNSKTKFHVELDDFRKEMIGIKQNAKPLPIWYDLTHVVVYIDEHTGARYFNGESWCPLFVSKSIAKILPYLKDNKFCILGDTLLFLKDSHTLGCFKLIDNLNGQITYSDIPPGVDNPRIASTADKTTAVLLSNETDRLISEVVKMTDEFHSVSPWRKIETDQYHFKFCEQDCIVYNIEKHQLVMLSEKTKDSSSIAVVGTDRMTSELQVYLYNIVDTNRFSWSKSSHPFKQILIPRDQGCLDGGKYLVIQSQSVVKKTI